MKRTMLKSKIHRARVIEADLNYIGSITIDKNLLHAADILPYEAVHVVDITNGARLETYAIEGPAGSGMIAMNGAAAHLIKPNDLIIIMSYVLVTVSGKNWQPKVVFVDENNRQVASKEELTTAHT